MRLGVVFPAVGCTQEGYKHHMTSYSRTYPSITPVVWAESHRTILYTSISKMSSAAMTFTEHLYAANMFERNLRR